MLAVGESVNLFFSHVRESSFISRSVIEIMMLMLWEGGWEWTTLTISSEIWSSSSSSSSFFFDVSTFDQKPIIPLEAVPKKSKKRQAKTRFSKICIWLRAVPKKSKKRQAKTLLLKIWSTPIALPAS
jgi:hypothetical protein